MAKHYPVEQRERAVRMVLDHLGEYRSVYAACAAIGPKVGVGKESLRRWVLQAQVDAEKRPGVTTAEQQRIREARESRSQGGQRDSEGCLRFLRAGARPAQPLICGFIDQMRAAGYRVESICAVLREQGLQVAPQTYRNWKTAAPSARSITDAYLTDALLITVGSPEGMYGRRKMLAHLRRECHQVAACTVDRLMRDEGLSGITRGRRHRTTIPDKNAARAVDLLDRDFTAVAPNRKWRQIERWHTASVMEPPLPDRLRRADGDGCRRRQRRLGDLDPKQPLGLALMRWCPRRLHRTTNSAICCLLPTNHQTPSKFQGVASTG